MYQPLIQTDEGILYSISKIEAFVTKENQGFLELRMVDGSARQLVW
jgi:hypothetical protein